MNVTEIFGCNVFNDEVMKNTLPKEVYKSLRKTIDEGEPFDSSIAACVANAMKESHCRKARQFYRAFGRQSDHATHGQKPHRR